MASTKEKKIIVQQEIKQKKESAIKIVNGADIDLQRHKIG